MRTSYQSISTNSSEPLLGEVSSPATSSGIAAKQTRQHNPDSRGEGGYTLVALIALMSVFALLISAAAPSMQQQAQREREIEAIRRGEEVADAIRLYVQYRGALPTSMEQLLEGVSRGTKKMQILRQYAARDPLTKSGEWRLVKPNTAQLIDFAKTVTLYAGGVTPQTTDRRLMQFAPQTAGLVTGLKVEALGSSIGTSDDNDGPFIGVMSRSKQDAVLTYYGADKHSEWVFTPLFK